MAEITLILEEEVEVGMVEDRIITIDHLVKSMGEMQANLLQSTAYYATPETICDQSWYANSGATNHVTSNLGNLSVQAEYRGNDRLDVGNRQRLNISHIGIDFFDTFSPVVKAATIRIIFTLAVTYC
ncbi:hypothetical protein ACOSQ3_009277 [Xanthoceras sorbifolium]